MIIYKRKNHTIDKCKIDIDGFNKEDQYFVDELKNKNSIFIKCFKTKEEAISFIESRIKKMGENNGQI